MTLAPGGRRERPVEDADLARAVRVERGGDGVDGLAGEGDDERLRPHALGADRCAEDVEPGQPLVVDHVSFLVSATSGLSSR